MNHQQVMRIRRLRNFREPILFSGTQMDLKAVELLGVIPSGVGFWFR